MFCTECGETNQDNAKFCWKCGNRLSTSRPPDSNHGAASIGGAGGTILEADPPRPGAALAAGTLILFSFSHYSASVHAMEKYKQPTMPLVIIDSQKSNGAPG